MKATAGAVSYTHLDVYKRQPQTYVEYGKWFYPADLPLEAVR